MLSQSTHVHACHFINSSCASENNDKECFIKIDGCEHMDGSFFDLKKLMIHSAFFIHIFIFSFLQCMTNTTMVKKDGTNMNSLKKLLECY